jgi:hypothetical protein
MLSIIRSTPDGNCLWHCLSYIFNYPVSVLKEYAVNTVKKMDIDTLLHLNIILSPYNYKYLLNQYLEEIYTKQAGDIELAIFSYKFNIRFVIFENTLSDNNKKNYGFIKNKNIGIKIIDYNNSKEKLQYYLFWTSNVRGIPTHWDIIGKKNIPYYTIYNSNCNDYINDIIQVNKFMRKLSN